MKRLEDLTIEDLKGAPVWRYEGGDGAEAMVVADKRDSLSQKDVEVFLAATDFTLPDSSRHLGFCFPVDDAGLDYLQPAIVTASGHVRFWFDGAVAPQVLSKQWNALGRRAEEIFPVRFRCRVPVDGRTVSGVIPALPAFAEAGPIPQDAAEPEEAASYRSRRPDGSVPSARPRRVKRLFANREGVFEKRTAPRHPVEMTVEFDEGGSPSTGVTGDVSRGGMFVRSARPPEGGPAVNLTVHLPGGRTLLLKGRVVRSPDASGVSGTSGFALRLTDKPGEYDSFLSRLPGHARR